MIFYEFIVWVMVIVFLIGLVMTLEARLSNKTGLILIGITSGFFTYYFAHIFLSICVLFGITALLSVRYFLSAKK